ncbi:MAG TPA: hypothetical protein VMV62_02715 [Candidatus Paceibacterota bacterium]|nr:hypothetical protein [Candidatus Paceibacterota bacterium]
MATLSAYERKLLDAVIEVTGDDESRIRDGIIKALRGIDDKGSRNYFWHLLETKAREKIRAARKRFARA